MCYQRHVLDRVFVVGEKRPVGPKTTGGRPHLGYATERATATLWKTMGRAIFLARPSVSAPI